MGSYDSRLARLMVTAMTPRVSDPRRRHVRAQVAALAAQHWDEAQRLVEEYGVLPVRRARPDLVIETSRASALRYLADRANQHQFRADRADELSGPPSVSRRWAREAAWFASGVERGLLIGRLLTHVGGAYAMSTNEVSVNVDCQDFYAPAGRGAHRLADASEPQVRAILIHEDAHANLAAVAPSLARTPGLDRSARLAAVLEGYPTWVGNRVAARKQPGTNQLVDPELHAWQLTRFSPDPEPGASPLNSPYRDGAAWFEQIHRYYGDAGVMAVVKLTEAELPRNEHEWHDVAQWGDATLGVPRRPDAPAQPVAPRHGKHRLVRGRKPGRHHRHGQGGS